MDLWTYIWANLWPAASKFGTKIQDYVNIAEKKDNRRSERSYAEVYSIIIWFSQTKNTMKCPHSFACTPWISATLGIPKRVQYQLAIWLIHFFKSNLVFQPTFWNFTSPRSKQHLLEFGWVEISAWFSLPCFFFSASHAALIST